MKKMKLVCIGNGMAGMRTIEELLAIAPDLYDITVFGAEPHPNYNRILLSPVLAGEQTIDDIILNTVEWYGQNGIRLHLGKTVTRTDRVRVLTYRDIHDTERMIAAAARVKHAVVIGGGLLGLEAANGLKLRGM